MPHQANTGRRLPTLLPILLVFALRAAHPADRFIPPGDLSLRHDIVLLADHGIVKGPVTSWPLAWASILGDIENVDAREATPPAVAMALARVRALAEREVRPGTFRYHAELSAADRPSRLRSFADTPREAGELGLGASWSGDRFSLEVNGQLVSSPDDGETLRADGSVLDVAVGNYSIGASTMDRWWGPGWDGNLILSNNARPIPAVVIDRLRTDAFETRWLRWLGPWDMNVIFGRMESDRAIPGARFFGFRLNFRPLTSLEIGLSRTAQWCGEGRPCGFDTFLDLLAGRDNLGDAGIGDNNEPGNQLAGMDARWTASLWGRPFAVYGQFIGEDEAGGFPSRYLAQGGMETTGVWRDVDAYRLFLEVSGTSCDVLKDDIFNCAYNHRIYETGYRYRGRSVGHTADNDALIASLGLVLNGGGGQWWVVGRGGNLNRGGPPDSHNTLTATAQDVASLDVYHSRRLRYGVLELGAGIERIDDTASNHSKTDGRFFARWRISP